MLKTVFGAALAVALSGAALAAEGSCLRGDNIDRVKMVRADAALATDGQKRKFEITFVGPCGARHQNVYFVLRPESLPTCVGAGTAMPTNREGVCVIKAITARS